MVERDVYRYDIPNKQNKTNKKQNKTKKTSPL